MRQTISGFLFLCLLIVGVPAMVALLMPEWVTVGFYLLILPGLILSLAPAVFLYLAAFSAAWFLLNRLSIAAGLIGGILAVVWLGFGLPSMLNVVTTYREMQAKAKEAAPRNKTGSGVRTLALEAPNSMYLNCGDLCQTLLYNGSVQRIATVLTRKTKDPNWQDRSYRIERMSHCPDATPRSAPTSWFKSPPPDGSIGKIVRLRIAGGECLIEDRTWTGKPDLVFERVQEDFGTPTRLAFLPGEVHVEGLQLKRADGSIIARQTNILAKRFTLPLLPVFIGIVPGAYFDFRRENYQMPDVDVGTFLERFTEFNLAPPENVRDVGNVGYVSIATRIDEALADPKVQATIDGVLPLTHDYYDSLPEKQVAASDVQRLGRLIGDPRIQRFRLPFHKLKPDQLLELRKPILDRLWQLANAKDWYIYSLLAEQLEAMPAGAFRDSNPDVERLLSDPEMRRFAPALVKRLADRGTAELPRLLSLLREAFAAAADPKARAEFRTGASERATLQGICRLGPKIQPHLRQSTLEALRSLAPRDPENDVWRATLVSLGASPNEYVLPKDVHWRLESYRESLRKMAANGCESR